VRVQHVKHSPVEMAREEYLQARKKLRDALVRVNEHRVEGILDTDVPDVRTEVEFLLTRGRLNLVPGLLRLVSDYVEAVNHHRMMSSDEAQRYEAAVLDAGEPDYLDETA
jgi:hypothetical protein